MKKTLKTIFILLSVVLVLVAITVTFFDDHIRKHFGGGGPPLPTDYGEPPHPKRRLGVGESFRPE